MVLRVRYGLSGTDEGCSAMLFCYTCAMECPALYIVSSLAAHYSPPGHIAYYPSTLSSYDLTGSYSLSFYTILLCHDYPPTVSSYACPLYSIRQHLSSSLYPAKGMVPRSSVLTKPTALLYHATSGFGPDSGVWRYQSAMSSSCS
eukprot:2600885-Rhodomonas_salina.2